MSSINIEVVAVKHDTQKTKNGKMMELMEVTYKNDGKMESKKIFKAFAGEEIWRVLGAAKMGDVYSIDREKNDAGYWDWVGLARQDAVVAPGPSKPVPTKPTYETPEERATRQVMIVRQSSISSAVNLVGPQKTVSKDTAALVIAIAEDFERYVMGNRVIDIQSDIPE